MGQKSLIYSFVARGTVILAEYTEFTGNFTTVASQCLQKLPSSNNRFTYNCDGHTFNYLVENGFSKLITHISNLIFIIVFVLFIFYRGTDTLIWFRSLFFSIPIWVIYFPMITCRYGWSLSCLRFLFLSSVILCISYISTFIFHFHDHLSAITTNVVT